jgi:hypothetical protein
MWLISHAQVKPIMCPSMLSRLRQCTIIALLYYQNKGYGPVLLFFDHTKKDNTIETKIGIEAEMITSNDTISRKI